MKRIIGVLLLVGAMAFPVVASADPMGIYVAPKFVYGLTQMEGVKGHWSEGGNSESIGMGSKTDDSYGGSIAIGYDFDKKFGVPIRAELEYAAFSKVEAERSYSVASTDHAKMQQSFGIQTLFLNAYWDINTETRFTPYLGAGLGMAFINTKFKDKGYDSVEGPWDESTGPKNVTNFAWNVGAGLGYDFTENWTLDVGYRFVGLGSVKTKTFGFDDYKMHGKADDLYQHQFAVGARFTF